jgi:DNA-binding response OmpR family regulator
MNQICVEQAMADRLLVVDDDQFQFDEIAHVAGESGIRDVRWASSEAEAYAQIGTEQFLLAVVDIMLSRPDELREGLRIIDRIRTEQPNCRIIALTTRGRNDVGIQALRAGADDFVCGDWRYINWTELLRQRLDLWRGVVRSRPERRAR